MSDEEQVSQALAELWDIVRCRCHEAYTGRGLHDPDCQCDSADAVKVVADRIEALTEQLAAASQDTKALEDELQMQEQEACMMENDYIKLEKERDALEAKLAKAVELALEECPFRHGTPKYNDWWHHRRATLAEIKGESHD